MHLKYSCRIVPTAQPSAWKKMRNNASSSDESDDEDEQATTSSAGCPICRADIDMVMPVWN